MRRFAAVVLATLSVSSAAAAGQARPLQPDTPNSNAKPYTLDEELTKRASGGNSRETTRVVVEWRPGATVPAAFQQYVQQKDLKLLNGSVLELPNGVLNSLAADQNTKRVHYDYPAFKQNFRTSITIGARAINRALGYTGAGVGIAVIDSGIASWHDDLTNRSSRLYPYGNQRVAAFVDFVNGRTTPYDDDGHGTHVAGIIAGNGYDSNGQKAGMAPDADLIVLKVLDQNGNGTISGIIRALDWVLANRERYNIRVVNMSVGAGIHESYWTDPLTLAAKRVVDAGVVVVAAAGNMGRNAAGQPQYGGIGAPGNAPWVLTVGASSTMGTTTRDDDTMASFSSRGPTYLDWSAKPDLVAPGVGTVSLAAPESTLYSTRQQYLLPGLISTPYLPYLSLSGTSMAAPAVSGSVALMLQVNPSLTPNAVKAILEYTAQVYPGYNVLTEGAGFLNTVGAVRLARFYAVATPSARVPVQQMWSRRLIWGNHLLRGGLPIPDENAFELGTDWGAAKTDNGDNIVWGTTCGTDACDNIVWGTDAGNGDNIVWGTSCGDSACVNIVWGAGTDGGDNIVWGTACGGADCDNIVWGTDASPGDNIVWGTDASGGDQIVWGTSCGDNGCDNIVWGTDGGDNIVWGTVAGDGSDVLWQIGAGHDTFVWRTDGNGGMVLWDSSARVPVSWTTLSNTFVRLSDRQVFDLLNALISPPPRPK